MGSIEFMRTYEKCLRERFSYYMNNANRRPTKDEKEEYKRIVSSLIRNKDFDFKGHEEEFDELIKSINDCNLLQVTDLRKNFIQKRKGIR